MDRETPVGTDVRCRFQPTDMSIVDPVPSPESEFPGGGEGGRRQVLPSYLQAATSDLP